MDTQSITEHSDNLSDEEISDTLEDRARHIGQAIRALMTDMNTYPDHVRPSVCHDVLGELPDFINACFEPGVNIDLGGGPEEAFQRFNTLSGEALGHILLQCMEADAESFDKRKWLDVAEVLGPDHAQVLYRAAVFTTKVA